MAKSRGLADLISPASARFYHGKTQAKISPELGAALDALSKSFGGETIGVTSGYRSPSYNKAVGGAKSSYHQKGMAVDIDMSGWSTAKRQEAIKTLTDMGVGGFITYSKSPDMLHIDMRQTPTGVPHFMHDKSARNMAAAPDWFKDMAAQAKPASIASRLPDTMQAPLSLAATQQRDEAIRTAYADNMRALDVVPPSFSPPSRPASPTPTMALNSVSPPSRFPGVAVGKVTRAPLDAIPASLTPAPIGRVERAPLPDIGQFTTPARSLAHPVSAPKPSPLAAAPAGQVTRAPLAPAAPNAQKMAEAYGQYAQSRVAADETAKLAAQYAQYQRAPAPPPAPTVATPPATPVGQLPAAPPAQTVAPAQVLAPALAPPKTIQDRPIADIAAPPAPPAATAYDVYAGRATQALDNTGQNTVGMLPDGTTTVTNKYGVTTGMTPYGKQTAVGNIPGVPSSFGRTMAKAAMPAIGNMALGPIGGLLGTALAYGLSRPGGILSDTRNINTSMVPGLGPVTAFARPDHSLRSFPSAPSNSGGMRDSFSRSERASMASISPGAAAAVGTSRGGLY